MTIFKDKTKSQRNIILFVIAFALIGAAYLIISKAATPSLSIEPEDGTVQTPATAISDSTASGGQAVKFVESASGDTVTIAAVGDMATSGSSDVTISTRVLNDSSISAVLAAGDIAYNSATESELTNHYIPSWGRLKAKTYPIVGNHEYFISPTPYFNYWASTGSFANTPKAPSEVIQNANQTWYAFNKGAWRIYAINTEKGDISSSQWDTQLAWLKADLAANPKACTLAFTHRPYWAGSSPGDSNSAGVSTSNARPLIDALVAAKGDIYIAGHEHAYVSFPKLSPSTNKADANGIRSWVSGIGGTGPAGDALSNKYPGVVYIGSNNNTGATGSGGASAGYLKLELKPTSYTWQFIDTAGAVRHSGSDTCRV